METCASTGFARGLCTTLTAVAVAGCFGRSSDTSGLPCEPGLSEPCYTGPEGTVGVGSCRPGVFLCFQQSGLDRATQYCVNEVTPARETCNGVDDDCDGVADNNGACQTEVVEAMANGNTGLLAQWRPEVVGPYVLTTRNWNTTYDCPPGIRGGDCIRRFMDEFGEAFGIASFDAQLVPVASPSEGDVGLYRFGQVHCGVDVEFGTTVFAVTDDGVQDVLATLLPVRSNMRTSPALDETAARLSLPNPSEVLAGSKLVIFTQRLGAPEEDTAAGAGPSASDASTGPDTATEGSCPVEEPLPPYGALPPVVKQDQFLAWRLDTRMQRHYVNAITGKLLWSEDRWYPDLQVKVDGSTNYSGLDAQRKVAWDLLAKFYEFMQEVDVFQLLPKGQPGGSKAGHFDLTFATDVKADYCSGEAKNPENPKASCLACKAPDGKTPCASGCATATEIVFCPGGYSREALLHEASHYAFLQFFKDASGAEEMARLALHEGLAMFHAELFECWPGSSGTCDWVHDGYDLGLPPEWVKIGNDYTKDGRRVARAWKAAYDVLAAGHPPQDASRMIRRLLYDSIRAGMDSILKLGDVFNPVLVACKSLVANKQGWSYDECIEIRAAFARAGLADCSKANPTPAWGERCNGVDDDCDSVTDGVPGKAGGDAQQRPLTDPCHWDPARPAAGPLGECHDGVRTCVDGDWGECVDLVTPAGQPVIEGGKPWWRETACDGKDNDCDGLTDEDLDDVKKWYAPDGDHDGFGWGPDRKKECPGLQPEGWVLWTDSMIDYQHGEDCDDNDPRVHPQPEDDCGQMDVKDYDCKNGPQDSCDCNPLGDTLRFCGKALAASCAGDPYSEGTCIVGDPATCRPGFVECQWDATVKNYVWSACRNGLDGITEICDSKDNDCDGSTDEGVKGLGPCGNEGQEECSGGKVICVGDKGNCSSTGTWGGEALPKHFPKHFAGDGEFDGDGHGPAIYLEMEAKLLGHEYQARVRMQAWECDENEGPTCTFADTRVDSWSEWTTVFSHACHMKAPSLGKLKDSYGIPLAGSSTKDSLAFIDYVQDQDETVPGAANGPVVSWVVTGDTAGDEAGFETGVTVNLRGFSFTACCD